MRPTFLGDRLLENGVGYFVPVAKGFKKGRRVLLREITRKGSRGTCLTVVAVCLEKSVAVCHERMPWWLITCSRVYSSNDCRGCRGLT